MKLETRKHYICRWKGGSIDKFSGPYESLDLAKKQMFPVSEMYGTDIFALCEVTALRLYDVNMGSNLTNRKAPCLLFLRNDSNYYWFDGWTTPCDKTRIPKELGETLKQIMKPTIAETDL